MKKMRELGGPSLAALLALGLLTVRGMPAHAADDIDQRAVDRAHNFLTTEQRGKDVLSYVHFGATYQRHKFKETRLVNDGDGRPIKGHFALVYAFDWEDDGISHVGFLCDARGNVYKTQVVYTNAVLNQPFALANGTIKLLGNLLIEALGDKLSADERKQVQKFVDDANAKAMLEWSLKFQQALAR